MVLPDYIINQVRKTAFNTATLPMPVHTVCEEARCPNRGECFEQKTVTFLLLGKTCTRNCRFCGVDQAHFGQTPVDEIERLLSTIQHFGLRYVVLTSVTRDDLSDGGASVFSEALQAIHRLDPTILSEVLTPDFGENMASIDTVCQAPLHVFNHNLELIPSIYKTYRPKGDFDRSLRILDYVKNTYTTLKVKTGIMVGLGETKDDVFDLIRLLKEHTMDALTIGQYLQPRKTSAKVIRFVDPEEFAAYEALGNEIGLKVVAGPLVRSSYMAHRVFAS